MKILVLDNYDSFTYNLVQLVNSNIDDEVDVYRNDKISIEDIGKYDKILLSPGPGVPDEAGILKELINTYADTKDIFGVCLGLQAIAEVFGGTLSNLPRMYHGIATNITVLKDDPIFTDVPKVFKAGRYHSWVAERQSLPDILEITAEDDDKNVMALRHKDYKIAAVQFHPESILTPEGNQMIKNWLEK